MASIALVTAVSSIVVMAIAMPILTVSVTTVSSARPTLLECIIILLDAFEEVYTELFSLLNLLLLRSTTAKLEKFDSSCMGETYVM